MAYQFLCPQGHLLQGDESQAGQQCMCPYCRAEFLVPQPAGTPQAAAAPADTAAPAEAEEPQEEAFPGISTGADFGSAPADVAVQFGSTSADQQSLLHIPCPHGHLLETPREMLGQDAMCPYCQAQFRLRFEDSQEYRQEKVERRERREQKLGRAWLHWTIAAAVVVLLGVILMIWVAVAD